MQIQHLGPQEHGSVLISGVLILTVVNIQMQHLGPQEYGGVLISGVLVSGVQVLLYTIPQQHSPVKF